MSVNYVIINGRIPNFDANYYPKEEENKTCLSWAVSVKRRTKKPDEQYYPEDLINFKAFGKTAKFIYEHFDKGSGIILEGELRQGEKYEKDGKTVTARDYILVSYAEGTNRDSSNSGGKNTSRPSRPSTPSTPGTPRKPSTPKGPRFSTSSRPW